MKRKILTFVIISAIISAMFCTVVFAGTWQADGRGWWYAEDDGSYPEDAWSYIEDAWYHFDSEGYMQTGWLKDGDTWYYLGEDGSMQTGWLKDGGTWYYLSADGSMQTGWLKDDGIWYYLGEDGSMQTEYPEIAETDSLGHITLEAYYVVDQREYFTAGETINFQITLKNDGQTKLNFVTVRNSLTDDYWKVAQLNPGETRHFFTEYVVTEEDVQNQEVRNTISCTGRYLALEEDITADPVTLAVPVRQAE